MCLSDVFEVTNQSGHKIIPFSMLTLQIVVDSILLLMLVVRVSVFLYACACTLYRYYFFLFLFHIEIEIHEDKCAFNLAVISYVLLTAKARIRMSSDFQFIIFSLLLPYLSISLTHSFCL